MGHGVVGSPAGANDSRTARPGIAAGCQISLDGLDLVFATT